MKIIKVFVWSIIVTLTFVCAFFLQFLIINPTTGHKNTVVVTDSVSVEADEKKSGIWALQWKDVDGNTTVLATSTEKNLLGYSETVQYQKNDKNYIFFYAGAYGADNFKLYLFDVNTKTLSTILDPGKGGMEPDQIEIINDTLYFSFLSYGPEDAGGLYYIDLLDPTLKINKIITSYSVDYYVVHKWGHYWVRESYASGGSGYESYRLFDTSSKEIGNTTYGDTNGESLIGVTKDNRAILFSAGWDILMRPLGEEKNDILLFDSEDLLAGTTPFYREDDNDLYLIGKEVWIYDFDTKETKKIQPVNFYAEGELSGFRVLEFLKGNKICLFNAMDMRRPTFYAILDMNNTPGIIDQGHRRVDFSEETCQSEEGQLRRNQAEKPSQELSPNVQIVHIP